MSPIGAIETVSLTNRKEQVEVFQLHELPQAYVGNVQLINDKLKESAYRNKFGVPHPFELRRQRMRYGFSSQLMSEVLGFGVNAYRNFENGELPTLSAGKLLRQAMNPRSFLNFAEDSHLLDKRKIESLKEKVELLDQRKVWYDSILHRMSSSHEQSHVYQKLDVEILWQMMAFFASNMREVYKTGLNKLLFYADMLHYRNYGHSISGASYVAIDYGPVPDGFQTLIGNAEGSGFIQIDLKPIGLSDKYSEQILPGPSDLNFSIFSQEEIESLRAVVKAFDSLKTKEIVNLSHEELAWLENKDAKSTISYPSYAFTLRAI